MQVPGFVLLSSKIQLETEDLLCNLYTRVSQIYGIEPSSFYLSSKGKPLNLNNKLSDYGLTANSLININHRCLGGMQSSPLQYSSPMHKKRIEKRSSTVKEFVRRTMISLSKTGEGTFKEQMEKSKAELESSINRDGEKFWDIVGIEPFSTPIKRILACFNDKDKIIIAEKSNTVHYYSIKKKKVIKSFTVPLLNEDEIEHMTLSYNDKYLILGTTFGHIHIYNQKKRDLLHVINSESMSYKVIKAITTVKIVKEVSSTSIFNASNKYNDEENESLLQKRFYTDEYLVMLTRNKQLAFISLFDKTENKTITKDLNQQAGKIVDFCVDPTHTTLKCFLDDGLIYDIDFKRDEDKNTISIYDRISHHNKKEEDHKRYWSSSKERSAKEKTLEDKINRKFEYLRHKLGKKSKFLLTINNEEKNPYAIIGLEILQKPEGYDPQRDGKDYEDDEKLFQISMIKSQELEVIPGTEIFASFYGKELTVMKSREKVDSIFDTNDKIDPNLSAKENSKRILRQKRALAKIDQWANCVAISSSTQRGYSGWEDGKILVVDYLFRRIIREIPKPSDDSLPRNRNRSDVIPEEDNDQSKSRDHKRDDENFLEVYSSESEDYDEDDDLPEAEVLINQKQNTTETDMDYENQDRLSDASIEEPTEVTALVLYENYLIAGYTNGLVIGYNQENFKAYVIHAEEDGEKHILCLKILENQKALLIRTHEKLITMDLDIDYNENNKLNGYLNKTFEIPFDAKKKNVPCLAASEDLAVINISSNTAVLINIEDQPEEPKKIILPENKTKCMITGLAISKDLHRVVVATSDCDIFIYKILNEKFQTELITDHNLRLIHEDKQSIVDMKMTEEGLMIFGLSLGGIRILEIESLEEIASFEKTFFPKSSVCNLALSSDDEFILVNSTDWSQKLIALSKKKQHAKFNLDLNRDYVQCIEISKKNPDIVVASCLNSLSFLNIHTKAKLAFKIDEEYDCLISGIQICEDTLYAAFSSKGIIRMMDIRRIRDKSLNFTTFAYIFEKDDGEKDDLPIINCMKLSSDNNYLICSLDSRSIKIYNRKTTEKYHVFSNLPDDAKDIIVHPAFPHLFFTAIENNVYIFNLKERKHHETIYNLHTNNIIKIAISNQGKYIATVCEDLKIKVLEWETKQIYYLFDESAHLTLKDPKTKELPKISSLLFAGRDRFLVYGGTQILKIQNLETKSLVYNFCSKDIIQSMAITDNSQYLIYGNISTQLFVYNMPIFVEESHTIPYSKVISPYIRIGTLSQLEMDPNESSEKKSSQASKHRYLTFWPHNWCILHFFAIKYPDRLVSIPNYASMKIRWVVDAYGRTPLHYLLAETLDEDTQIDYNAVNKVFEYILDFLEDNIYNKLTFYQTMKSLSNISTLMFAKCHPELLHRYLHMAFCDPYTLDFELPRFGIPNRKMEIISQHYITEDVVNKLHSPGSQGITFRIVVLYNDYHYLSEDMLSLVLVLQKIGDQNFFKTRTISTLVNYLWEANLKFNYAVALCYTLLMLLAAIDLTMDEPPLALQIIILILDCLFILHEFVQVSCYGVRYYFRSIWNYFDMSFFILLIIAIALQFEGVQNNIGANWVFSFVFLAGFARWVTYLRLFDLSRNLIRTILDIMVNMWGFAVIIFTIILGFCLTFYVFDKSYYFSDYLLVTYNMLYGNNELENPSTSQTILAVSVTFMLGVFFLNMLVAIMNDAFTNSQRLHVINDAKERLDIIYESTNILRLFSKKSSEKKGYLVFCEKEPDNNTEDEVDPKDLTDNVNFLKRTIHKSTGNIITKLELKEQSMDSRFKNIENNFKAIAERFDKVDENMIKNSNDQEYEIKNKLDQFDDRLNNFDQKFENLTQAIEELKNLLNPAPRELSDQDQ